MCSELQLGSEFCVKIAHQIREQIEFYRRNTPDQGTRPEPLNLKRKTRNLIEQGTNIVDMPCTVGPNNYLRSNFDEEFAW